MNPLLSLAEYEVFAYTLPERYPVIRRSTLVVIRRGTTIAVLQGEVELLQGYRLIAREKLSFAQSPGEIKGYGYEVWHGDEQLYWYDSQSHPAIKVSPALIPITSTFHPISSIIASRPQG